MRALVVVDLQMDFLPNGALAVQEGDLIIPSINAIQDHFDLVVATQDWHPVDHQSFASQHENQGVYDVIELEGIPQVLWPDHCIQGTAGAAFSEAWDSNPVAAVFRKGMNKHIDSYSGFYDNNKREATGLLGFLKEKNVTEVYVCGLAAEYCVFYTAMDARNTGFDTYFLAFATKPISAEGLEQAKVKLKANGVVIVNESEEVKR
ncbi:bifunctional nicotinamidase/pyrazinamidase [Myroides sp. DW712]|uniref:bifunctional nicotinamidase/pyrazinamidase n=1 Tax=Myroides sp. DW712 TaxID=3389800 RepID=UPI003978CC78